MTASVPRAGRSPDEPPPAVTTPQYRAQVRANEHAVDVIAAGLTEASWEASVYDTARAVLAVLFAHPDLIHEMAVAFPLAPWDVSRLCDDTAGPDGVGGSCVLPVGHPHVDGIGSQWTAMPPRLAPEALARALHDAGCGCGDYDDVKDPRYIQAVRAAFAGPGAATPTPAEPADADCPNCTVPAGVCAGVSGCCEVCAEVGRLSMHARPRTGGPA